MKRLVSVLLVLCLCVSSVSVFAYASYSDLSPHHWAKEAINMWTSRGALNGLPDGTFHPDEHMTRSQFGAFLSRALKLENADLSTLDRFPDVSKNAWYTQTFANCVNAKIINGTSFATAEPDAFITRQEAAAMVCRAFGIEQLYGVTPDFTDSASISSWALPYVAALSSKEILCGYPDKSLKPKGYLTRAEAVFLAAKADAVVPVDQEYTLLVSVRGLGSEGANSTLSHTVNKVSKSDRITDLLTDVALENRTQLFKVFFVSGMKEVMASTLKAFAAGGNTWSSYAKKMSYAVGGDVVFKQVCIDNAPVSALIAGVPYTLEFLGYTLTVTLISK